MCWFGPILSQWQDLQQHPAQRLGPVLPRTTTPSCQTAKLFSSRSWPFHLVPSSPPVTSPLSLGVPAATIISFSSHNVKVTPKKLLDPRYGTAKTDVSPSLCSAWRAFCCFIKVSNSPGPLNTSTNGWCNCLTALPHPSSPSQNPSTTKWRKLGYLGRKVSPSPDSVRWGSKYQELFTHCTGLWRLLRVPVAETSVLASGKLASSFSFPTNFLWASPLICQRLSLLSAE